MTSTDCLRLVEAEMGVGERLLQVGFMRRFDQGYLDMKAAVDGKRFGSPLFLHCIHRIATAPHYFKTELIPFASAVHEIDAARFGLGEEFSRVSVHPGRPSANAPERYPLLFIFQSASGVLMDVEISTDAQYGYDVRAELVMESGALALVVAGRDFAVATSGVAERGPHIVNPHTGQPATELASITVVGAGLTLTDAYATAAFAMGPEARDWVESLDGYEAFAITARGADWQTSGFRAYLT